MTDIKRKYDEMSDASETSSDEDTEYDELSEEEDEKQEDMNIQVVNIPMTQTNICTVIKPKLILRSPPSSMLSAASITYFNQAPCSTCKQYKDIREFLKVVPAVYRKKEYKLPRIQRTCDICRKTSTEAFQKRKLRMAEEAAIKLLKIKQTKEFKDKEIKERMQKKLEGIKKDEPEEREEEFEEVEIEGDEEEEEEEIDEDDTDSSSYDDLD